MATVEHTINSDTNTQHVFIAWYSGECVRYTIDSDCNAWLTGYSAEGGVIATEYAEGEHLYLDGGNFKTVADTVLHVIDTCCGE